MSMTSRHVAAAILHELAGTPAVEGCARINGRCWVCAAPASRGLPVARWQGANFTDQNKVRWPDATHVCEPCIWAMSWVPPPGMPPPEQGTKGLNLRLFSHLYDDRGYRALNKANKPAILQWLREPKQGEWFAAIADTGQKHVLPWTPINPAGGNLVLFEERCLSLPEARGWSTVDAIKALLDLGVTKAEVETGDYSARSYQYASARAIGIFEHEHGCRRGAAWFALALWLPQADQEAVSENRQRKSGRVARPYRDRRAGDAAAIPSGRRQPAQALAADPRQDPNVRPHHDERTGVGDGDAVLARDIDAEQLSLFGNPGSRG